MTKRSAPLKPSKRDAPALWHGVTYQKIVTLLAWLELRGDEELFVEVGEDFLSHGPNGGVAVQVRGTRAELSLSGAAAHQIIQFAFDRPPEISTVYWSTSPPGRERGLYATHQVSGVELWSRAAEGEVGAIEALRRFLRRRGGWSEPLAAALASQSADSLRTSLFGRIKWDLRQLPSDALERRARARLMDRLPAGYAAPGHAVTQLLPKCLDHIEKVAQAPFEERHLDRHALALLVEETIATLRNIATLAGGGLASRQPSSASGLSQAILEAAKNRLGAISAADIEIARADLARGRLRAAAAMIDRWTADEDLTPEARAAALRLRAEASLVLGDPDEATGYAQRARETDGGANVALELRILAAREPEAALAQMAGRLDDPWLETELLVRLGRGAEARAIVDRQPSHPSPSEARIRALAFAVSGDVPRALSELEPLLARTDDLELRGVAAVLHYVAAQAPGITVRVTPWPTPTHSGLVRRSPQAIEHLSRAAALFGETAVMVDDPPTRANRSVWRLACVIDLPAHRGDAERLAHDLMSGPAPHPGAVHWALARGIAFDERAVEARLAAQMAPEAESLIAAATLMRNRDADDEAETFLSERLAALNDADRTFVEAWISRMKSSPGDNPLLAALARGRQTGDWHDLEGLAEAGETAHRLMALQVLDQEGRWDAVARHRDFLVRLDTPDALFSAISALFNAGQAGAALELFETRKASFGEGPLPEFIAVLQVDCLVAVGRLPEAFVLLERWPYPSNSRLTRMLRVRVNLNIGDLESVALDVAGGRLSELPPELRLRVANQIAPTAPAAARQLLGSINLDETNIELAPLAFEAAELASADAGLRRAIAHRLFGGEAQAAGVVTAVSIDDVLEMMRQHAAEVRPDAYLAGDALIHREVGPRLGYAFSRLLTGEGPTPDLFVRDAAAREARPIRTTVLRLDAPAILTAHALGLMEPLYAAFERIEVSQHLPIALQQIERELRGPQPDSQDAADVVLAALHDAAIQVGDEWVAPERTGEALNAADIAAGLLAFGRLTAAQAAELELGGEATSQTPPPAPGRPIRLSATVLQWLARADLLRAAGETWQVMVDPHELATVRDIAEATLRTRAAAASVGELRRAVGRALRVGRLTALPRAVSEPPDTNAVLESLRDLRGAGAATIWTEDRSVHLRRAIDDLPVVEVFDVLEHLERGRHLTAAQATEALRRLRDAGFRFLPLSSRELLRLLRAAPVAATVLFETPELAAARRAYAADLRREPALRLHPDAETPTAETKFALWALKIFDETLRLIWSQRDSVMKKRAWSDWLWGAFRCERLERAPLVGPSEAGKRSLYEIEMAGRLSLGYVAGRTPSGREAAFDWVWRHLIAPELEADATLGKALGDHFATFWCEPFMREDGARLRDSPKRLNERASLCAAGLTRMPQPMRALLLANPRLNQFLGDRFTHRLSFGELAFEAEGVLRAVSAVSGKSGAARKLTRDGQEIVVRATASGVHITAASVRTTAVVEGDLLELIVGGGASRLAAADRLLTEVDLAPETHKVEVARLANLASPYQRLVALNEIRATSIGGKLEEIVRLASLERLDVGALAPPSPEAFRRWWRCAGGANIDPSRLRDEVGQEWVSRVASAPLRAWSALADLSDQEAATYLDLPPKALSPLGELACVALAARKEASGALLGRVERVISRFETDGKGFVDLVILFQHRADQNPAWRAEDEAFRSLAMWAWADLVWRGLAQSGRAPDKLADFWRGVVGRRPRAMVLEARGSCAAAAPFIGAPRLLAIGLAVALGARRDEVWSNELTSRTARFVLDDAPSGGPKPFGPLTEAPDRAVTWLADASPFIWLAAGDQTGAVDAAVDAYPEDERPLAALALAGPDVIHPAAADALIDKLERSVHGTAASAAADRWLAELQYLGVALGSLRRRSALDETRKNRILRLFERLLSIMSLGEGWAQIQEGVYHFVFGHLSAISTVELSAFLTRAFAGAVLHERKRIGEVTEIYLSALPFEERAPLWQALLGMRASL